MIKKAPFFLLTILILASCESENGLTSLLQTTILPNGSDCPAGGVKIEAGIDKNSNGVLDADEIQSTSFSCNGLNSLLKKTNEAAGTNCVAGGYKLESGLDSNNNGVLESSEVTSSIYVCNGEDGATNLIKVTSVPGGPECATGGIMIETGIDVNRNATLEASEIKNTSYLCNGAKSLLKKTDEPLGTNCYSGGYKLESGLDSNNNGVLENSEITNSFYVCNGEDGITNLIKVISVSGGANCAAGGIVIETGIDTNQNATLEASEIKNTSYLCNGLNSLLKKTDEPAGAICSTGGYKLESGLDSNNNGLLDNTEVTNSIYVCNGDSPYLDFVAGLSQTGTNVPTAVVLVNTLQLTINWTRLSQGKFKGILNKNLDLSKSVILSNNVNVLARFVNQNEIRIEYACGVNAYCDDFDNFFFEIKSLK